MVWALAAALGEEEPYSSLGGCEGAVEVPQCPRPVLVCLVLTIVLLPSGRGEPV